MSRIMAHEELSPLNITPGAIRFNTDSMKLEYFRIGMEGGSTSSYAGIGTMAAGEWVQITTDSPEVQTGGTRGVIAGGLDNPNTKDNMNYINVDSVGTTLDFGTLSSGRFYAAGFGSRTHGFMAGASPGSIAIERWVTATTGSSADYTDLSQTRNYNPAGMSNSTRGVIAGGQRSDIEYITMSSNAIGVNFGNLASGEIRYSNGSGNCTRGIIVVGIDQPAAVNTVEYITISTQGNSANFGDVTNTDGDGPFSCSNSTRVVRAGGGFPAGTLTIDSGEIATLGDFLDFGDLTQSRYSADGMASPTRGVFAGGAAHPSYYNTIDYVQFASKGNAVDFGDLLYQANYLSAVSNGHGGLG